MKLIPALLIVGMFAVSGCSKREYKQEPYYLKFTKKAEAGDAYAQFNLGLCYFGGLGVGKDEKEAVKWYTKAAQQGNESAKKELEKLKSK